MTSLIDDAPEGVNTPEYSVSDLSGAVKRTVEGAFGHVRVRGEIGRVSRPRSGHLYLDLKDDRAVLAGIVWKGVANRLQTQPEEGMEVVATGRLTTFPGQSKYQIVIEDIAPAGVGALMAMLEKRRKALAAEGLFDADRKRALPFLPKVIGVVTSPSGAVIRDILHRVAERFAVHVLVWPVAVQGAKCASEVAAAINGFSVMQGPLRPDVIIVARGGGSVEDLWGFNEDVVVRAAADCTIPLISAVGHETDTTLIDHAADLRAPTPTAAAERAVPVRAELAAMLADLQARRLRALEQGQDQRRQRLTDLARALPRAEQILGDKRQRLDTVAARMPRVGALTQTARHGLERMADRLPTVLQGHIAQARVELARKASPLTSRLLAQRLTTERSRLERPAERLAPMLRVRVQEGRTALARPAARFTPRLLRNPLSRCADRVTGLGRLLGSLGYRQTLARGYGVVRDESGRVISAAEGLSAGQAIELEFQDGRIATTVSGAPMPDAETAPSASVKPTGPPPNKATKSQRAPRKPDPGQGSLF